MITDLPKNPTTPSTYKRVVVLFAFIMDLTKYAEMTHANNIHFTFAIHTFHGTKFTF